MKNLKNVYDRYNFTPDRVYNCHETGIITIHKPPKVAAVRGEKKKKQVGQETSAKCGDMVTLLFIINGIRNAIPPLFVYRRVYFKNYFLNGFFPLATDHIIKKKMLKRKTNSADS